MPRRLRVGFGASSRTLPAAAGAYSLGGAAAALRGARRIAAAAGSYGITGSAATLTPPGSGLAAALAADWVARSTAAGVTLAQRFTSYASDVQPWRHMDGFESRVVFDATDGILGDGCLRFNILKADGTNSGNWRRSLNPAWTSDTQGFGSTKFYVQFRVKIGPTMIEDGVVVRGQAPKICNLAGYKPTDPNSSDSNTLFETVLFYRHPTTVGGNSRLEAYRVSTSSTSDSFSGDPTLTVENVFDVWEGDWITIQLEIQIAVYGAADGAASAGNSFVMRAAGPSATAWTTLYSASNFSIDYDPEYPNGFSGVWFLPYETGRTQWWYDTWQKYDQLIVSTQPIALPLAHKPALPSYLSGAAFDTWGNVPGSGTLAAAGAANAAQIVTAYTGFAHDTDRYEIQAIAAGGHGDRGENDGFAFPVLNSTPAWTRIFNPSASSALADPPPNHSGARGDGSRYADHNYNLPQYADGKVFFPFIAAISGSAGNSSSACWYWNRADLGNGSLGYTNLGLADSNYPTGYGTQRYIEAGSAYDPVTKTVWAIMQNYESTARPLVRISTVAPYTVTTYTTAQLGGGNGSTFHTLIVHPGKRVLLLIGDNATYRMDLDNPATLTFVSETSRPALNRGGSGVFHAAGAAWRGAVYFWPNGGTSLYKLSFPENIASGPWVWSTITNAGSGPANITQGFYKKLGAFVLPDGTLGIFAVDSSSGPVKFLRVNRNGR